VVAVVQHTAVAAVLALGSERTAIAAVVKNLVQGRNNSTRPEAEGLGMPQLSPFASPQHDFGLVLVRAGVAEILAAQHAELLRHAVPVAVRLAKPKYFHS
jgi:type IV secretory pathway protease TraF